MTTRVWRRPPHHVAEDAWREVTVHPVACALFAAAALTAVAARALLGAIEVLPPLSPGRLAALLVVLLPTALAAGVDARTHRLPDVLVLPVYPMLAAVLLVTALVDADGGPAGRVVLAGLVAAAATALLHLVTPAGLGFGDVKLVPPLAALCAWDGWLGPMVWLVASWTSAGVAALVLLVTRQVSRGSSIPLGPHLVVGALVAVVLAPV
ncbi:prepilin peptidase [Sanguibacter antarcticus]|uniref:Type 4 prepilin peptidase 1 n=1 Tax=Sanguibacter antarcticus TaxID=372484 RepID=A0A2A9E754_9MICO|nr:A24 family peptidase [Sanguibacter antarcticus]PFG34694.1 type 4 prepilin peptidase 1 [Sanguibacter antarcticus]